MSRRIATALGFGALALAALARAAAPPDATEILRRVERAYRGFTSFEFIAAVSVEMGRGGAHQNLDYRFLSAASRPNRFRNQIDNPIGGATLVSDGKSIVVYASELKQYTRKPAPRPVTGVDSTGRMAGPNSPVARYFGITSGLARARWLRLERVPIGASAVECDVVAVDYTHPEGVNAHYSPTTYWIDRGRSIVLRESTFVSIESGDSSGTGEMAQSTTYVAARVNQPVADSVFAFRPPADAQEVTHFPGEQAIDLSGQKASDFTLSDLAGKPVKLSSLRGKVVLLDFWATWCGPCRIEMPRVQKFHDEFQGKGLVVLGVNDGEDAGRIETFLKRNGYSFRILLDRDQSVAARYQVTGIPSLFVIDRNGVISSHFIGLRDEETLRDALARAGIQ